MLVTGAEIAGQNMSYDAFEDFTTFVETADFDLLSDSSSRRPNNLRNDLSAAVDVSRAPQDATATEDDNSDRLVGLDVQRISKDDAWSCYQSSFAFLWQMPESTRQTPQSNLQTIPSCPLIHLPSRHTLTRYFQSYTAIFHRHIPVLHLSNYSVADRRRYRLLLLLLGLSIGVNWRIDMNFIAPQRSSLGCESTHVLTIQCCQTRQPKISRGVFAGIWTTSSRQFC